MPRRSKADLTVIPINPTGKPARLRPPPHLGERARKLFTEIVSATDSRHFVPSDEPLLARYCEAIAQSERAEEALRSEGDVVNGRPSPWIAVQTSSVRTIATLATRLRLSPHSRTDPKTAGRRAAGPGPS